MTVTVDVINSGDREGDEVAQLYLSSKGSVPMPFKQLRGFKRVNLKAGEAKTVEFVLSSNELSYWSTVHNHYFVEHGNYLVRVGGSSDNLPLSNNFSVISDYIIPYGGEVICDDCPVTGVMIPQKTNTILVDQSINIQYEVLPKNATNKEVIFISDDTSVVTINKQGLMVGRKEGTTKITVKTSDGGFTDDCNITVNSKPSCPTWQKGVNYQISTVVLYNGQTFTSNNDWNGSAGDPYTMTHSTTGWGWTIGGNCNKYFAYFLR